MVDPALLDELARQLQGSDGIDGRDGVDGAPGRDGLDGTSLNTLVPFSTLPGTTDDDRLDEFFRLYGASAFKPVLVKDRLGDITFRKQHVLPKDGLRWMDFQLATQDDSHNGNSGAVKIRLDLASGAKGLFRLPDGECWNFHTYGLAFDATPNDCDRLIEPNPNCKVWKATFVDCSYANGPGLIGSSAVAQPVDTLVFAGAYVDLNNITDVGWNVAGADSKLGARQTLLNCPTTLKKSGPLAIFSSMSKSGFGGFYITAQEAQIGLHVKGGGKGGLFLGLPGDTLEGRLDVKPAWGSLARLEADTSWIGVNVNYAMTAPANGWGGAVLNQGLIHAVSGNHTAIGLVSRYAAGVSSSVPLWYQSSGSLIVNGIRALDSVGKRFRPVVKIGQAVDLVAVDQSVIIQRF